MSDAEQARRQWQSEADRIVYYNELKQRYGKSRTTIWRWVKSGHFPAPVNVGANSVGWWESALRSFDEKINGGNHAA